MINKLSVKTKFGWISAYEKHDKIFKISFSKANKQKKSKVLLFFKNELLKFFNNRNFIFKTKFEIEGNKTQKKIWFYLKKIKSGETKSYGEIAKKFNISPRHVGKICGQNKLPIYIPCHRVIRSDGKLGGFSADGGVKLKEKLLNFEKLV